MEIDVRKHLEAWRRHAGRTPHPEQDRPTDYPGDDRPTVEVPQESIVGYLARHGRTDPEIARLLHLPPHRVRTLRRRLGIPGNRYRSGWEQVLAAAHANGLTNAEIVARTGYTLRTVQELLSRLGLPANRR